MPLGNLHADTLVGWENPVSLPIEDIDENLIGIANADSFLEYLKSETSEEICDKYGETVYDLCRNAAAWMLRQMIHLFTIEEVAPLTLVGDGFFRGHDHTWLIFDGYIIDLTLAQFIETDRVVCIPLDKAEKVGYQCDNLTDVEAWINLQMDETLYG